MRFAERMKRMKGREMLNMMELADRKDLISFAGGFPSPETYPMEEIKASFFRVLNEDPDGALSYSSTRGYVKLRELIARRMERNYGLDVTESDIIVTNGSQQALDLTGLLFIDKGDVVLFESPSYLGALNALKSYEPDMIAVPTDEDGICIDALKDTLEKYGQRVKLIYVIPDFQNPTGRCWSEARRRAFMELVQQYEVAVLEDAAYSELNFSGRKETPLVSMDKANQVVYCGTFSKVFCPGIRIGWIYTNPRWIDAYLLLKNNVDLSSAAITQRQMADYLLHNDLDAHIAEIIETYRARKDAMAEAFAREMPEGVSWNSPHGGLFFWVCLPEGYDAGELLKLALKENVAFVPGQGFYPNGERKHEFRMNFSNLRPEEIQEGVKRLGRVVRIFLGRAD
ncbi:MAG: PLP-dependent aminotransferase family protein [Anaerovoracaceae bacterium]|nr:PLP-dependent aminotransferase family protein [Anaerovoracaceae bacterium]